MARTLRDGERVEITAHAFKRLTDRKHLYIGCGPLPKIDVLSLVQKAWDNCADGARLGSGFLMIHEIAEGIVQVRTFTPSLRKGEIAV